MITNQELIEMLKMFHPQAPVVIGITEGPVDFTVSDGFIFESVEEGLICCADFEDVQTEADCYSEPIKYEPTIILFAECDGDDMSKVERTKVLEPTDAG